MVGREDLHSRPDLGTIADRYLDDIEDHAVEVQENARAEADVEAVVAVERRPDHGTISNEREAFHQQFAPVGGRHIERGVVAREPPSRRL